MTSALLPTNATLWERSLADAMPPSTPVGSAIVAIRRAKLVNPTPTMLPFLVYEYGLGELTPYLPNLYNLIDQGIDWQRLRGTVSAVAMGLAWIGYQADIEEAFTGRRFWNSFQLRFPALPANDDPDLERIEGITSLSVPLRSKLRRGVFQYDVDAAQGDHTRLDNCYLEHESGIAVTQGGTLWSFGRTHEFPHLLTEEEGQSIGNWIDEPDGEPLAWLTLDYAWVDADFAWVDDPEAQRRALMAAWFNGRDGYLVLKGAGDAVIGYRRCRVIRPVAQQINPAYTVNGEGLNPRPGGQRVYIEAMTGFGDAVALCSSISLLVGATRAEGVKPGKLWLMPEDIEGGEEIAVQSVSIPLRTTVRERFKILLRF